MASFYAEETAFTIPGGKITLQFPMLNCFTPVQNESKQDGDFDILTLLYFLVYLSLSAVAVNFIECGVRDGGYLMDSFFKGYVFS